MATCPAAAASVSAAATTPQQRGQKRPRGSSSSRELPRVEGSLATLPSGLSGVEAGGGDDGNANDFSLWMTQVGDGLYFSEVVFELFFGAQSRSTLFVAAARVSCLPHPQKSTSL